MKRLAVALAIGLTGCAGFTKTVTQIPYEGDFAYNINMIYGGPDGTLEQAMEVVDREAKLLCPDGYETLSQESRPRTSFLLPNGGLQDDLSVVVVCK